METTRLTTRELFAAVARAPGVSASLCSQLHEELRVAWSVQVLGAWADEEVDRVVPSPRLMSPTWRATHAGTVSHVIEVLGVELFALGRDAARLVAALAVFPTLRSEVRANLGECP